MRKGQYGPSRLEVSRTTVYDWAARKKLLAWRSTKRGLTIPVEQILGPGKVVPGLASVLDVIDDPELAWAFLTQDWPFADEAARPLDKLARDEVEDVVSAAPGSGCPSREPTYILSRSGRPRTHSSSGSIKLADHSSTLSGGASRHGTG